MSFETKNDRFNQESTSTNSTKEICKYFLLGKCRFGDNCFNSHELASQSQSQSNETSNICKYYLKGCCLFGENCFYKHAEATNVETNLGDNTHLVKRIINKPQLVELTTNTLTTNNLDEISNENIEYSPNSYYEALTGKKLDKIKDINDIDMSMFDENYIYYMKRKLNSKNVNKKFELCPYFEKNFLCPFENSNNCDYTHGDLCDLCNQACLNPFDSNQRDQHRKECMKQIEAEMEEAFAIQRSSEKQCGICMETVWNKENLSDRRFGVLENCNHCFCLECIRKWRSSKSYENKIVKACPECRLKSDYVTPSKYWFENEDNKKKIIDDYKAKLGKTACKYFKQGDGECPFGNKCFYLHQYKDGRIAELPEPSKRRRFNQNGNLETYSNLIHIDFDYSDDEFDDEFDLMVFLRQNLISDTDTESIDYSDLFDLSNDFLNLFTSN